MAQRAILALGLLVALASPAAAQSRTGIETVACTSDIVANLDSLNEYPNGRARITRAVCAGSPTAITRVRLVAQDGRPLDWEPQQGTDALAWMIAWGRERGR